MVTLPCGDGSKGELVRKSWRIFTKHSWRRLVALTASPLLLGGTFVVVNAQPANAAASYGYGYRAYMFGNTGFGVGDWLGSYRFQTPGHLIKYGFCASPNGLREPDILKRYDDLSAEDLRYLDQLKIFDFIGGTSPIGAGRRRALMTAVNWFGGTTGQHAYYDPAFGGDTAKQNAVVHAALKLVVHDLLGARYLRSNGTFVKLNVDTLRPNIDLVITQNQSPAPSINSSLERSMLATQIVNYARMIKGFSTAYANGGTYNGKTYVSLGDVNPGFAYRPSTLTGNFGTSSQNALKVGDTFTVRFQQGFALRNAQGKWRTLRDVKFNVTLPSELQFNDAWGNFGQTRTYTTDASGQISVDVRVVANFAGPRNITVRQFGSGIGANAGPGSTFRAPGSWGPSSSTYGMQDMVASTNPRDFNYTLTVRPAGSIITTTTTAPTTTTTLFEPPVGS